jgi:hypothetical protein
MARAHTRSLDVTDWQFYPQTRPLPGHLENVIAVFDAATPHIGSKALKLTSNQVLGLVAEPLEQLGFRVETGTSRAQKVYVPVMFGRMGRVAKAFEVDAFSEQEGTVIEVEAGRGVVNNQFLKDLFEACVMPSVSYLVIAVRSDYRGQNDFEKVCSYLDSLYASDRLRLPLEGLLVVGY